MSYVYAEQRKNLFTEEGLKLVMEAKDKALFCIQVSGAVKMDKLLQTGSSWDSLAAVDYLVETKIIREITPNTCWGQDRVFVAAISI